MSEEEKELQDPGLEDMELDDFSKLVDFTDLDGLENVDDMDVFGDLGDISDLGDVPDLSALDMEPAVPDVPEISLDSTGEEVPDSFLDMDSVMPEEPADDLPGADDLLDSLKDLDLSGLEESASESEESVPDMSFDEMPEAAEEPVADMMPDMALDENMEASGEPMADMMADLALDDNPEDAGLDLNLDALSDGMGGVEESAGDGLGDITVTEDGLLDNLDIDFSALEEPGMEESAPAEEGGMNSMLDGLLDNLDMNGELQESAGMDSDMMGADADISELLGLDETPFDENGTDSLDALTDDVGLDMLDAAAMMPEQSGEAEKKPGFFKRVFGNVVTDEIAEQERQAAQKEEEEAAKQAEEEAKLKEEKEAKAAEKKAEKEAKAAEKKAAKDAKKAEKAKQKAEKKAQAEEEAAKELEVVGKLNKVGVSIIVIATVLFLTVEITGTNIFSYVSAKKEAMDYFEMGKYTEAYQTAVGTDMRNKDEEEYNRIKTVMRVQQCLNAYQNYDRMKYYPEAIDALIRGIKRYDANIEQATQLEVDRDLMSCRKQIVSLLQSEFQISEAKAYSLLAMDKEAYQNEVIRIGLTKVK